MAPGSLGIIFTRGMVSVELCSFIYKLILLFLTSLFIFLLFGDFLDMYGFSGTVGDDFWVSQSLFIFE